LHLAIWLLAICYRDLAIGLSLLGHRAIGLGYRGIWLSRSGYRAIRDRAIELFAIALSADLAIATTRGGNGTSRCAATERRLDNRIPTIRFVRSTRYPDPIAR
jgi:hypothetical protein